jgi:hypothetical protein
MNLSEISQENLEEFKQTYPYSAIGYLLSARLKKEKGEPFTDDANKAALFINNPLWLHALLNEQYTSDTNPFIIPVNKSNPPVVVAIQSKQSEESITKEVHPQVETEFVPIKVNAEEELVSEVVLSPIIDEEASNLPNHFDEIAGEESKPVLESTETSFFTEPPIVNEPDPKVKLSTEPLLPEIAFEPYHTIDYFASQGIKLKLEDLKDDQFSRQLKSFTEWLRTMKRISPVQESAAASNKEEEETSFTSTDQVEETDIATEAMAEVWLKQGQKNRALAIYHKLSLQNPAKSHYFASKIENLKSLVP